MAHARQKAALRQGFQACLPGFLVCPVACLFEGVDAVGQSQRENDHLGAHAELHPVSAVAGTKQLKSQRARSRENQRAEQKAPGQGVVGTVTEALAPDINAGAEQND